MVLRPLNGPYIIQQIPTGCFTYGNVHVSMLLSQFVPPFSWGFLFSLVLFRSVFVNLQVSWSFPRIFMFDSAVVWKHVFFLKICWCMFYDPRCYLSWWTFHVSLARMYIPLVLGKVVYRCQLHPVDQWCYWVLLHPSGFLPARSIHFFFIFHPFLIVSNYESGFVSFSFQLYQFLPHVCWCSIVRHIHVKPS